MVSFIKKRFIIIIFIIMCLASVVVGVNMYSKKENKVLIGGSLEIVECLASESEAFYEDINLEKYFRPSNLPILNDNKDINKFIWESENVEYKNVEIPKEYLKSPENTIINYFSLLREAANPEKDKYTGCGSIGEGKAPYPIAYNFFTNEYKEKIKYRQYEDSFKNILHINLIKFKEIPETNNKELKYFYEIETIQGSESGIGYLQYEDSFKNILHINLIKFKEIPETNNKELKYFYEIETIQGSESGIGYFAYYYGYINLVRDNDVYKISNITVTPEEYLCAPYHSWFYSGEYSVQIKYGNWCNLIKGDPKVEINDYVKDIQFDGTDGKEYKIEFFTLTNDYDIEVAQFKKNSANEWERIYLNPENCLKNK